MRRINDSFPWFLDRSFPNVIFYVMTVEQFIQFYVYIGVIRILFYFISMIIPWLYSFRLSSFSTLKVDIKRKTQISSQKFGEGDHLNAIQMIRGRVACAWRFHPQTWTPFSNVTKSTTGKYCSGAFILVVSNRDLHNVHNINTGVRANVATCLTCKQQILLWS